MVLAMTLTLLPKPLVHRAWWRMSLILKANPLQEDMLENLLEVRSSPPDGYALEPAIGQW